MLQKPGPILTVLGCMFKTMPPAETVADSVPEFLQVREVFRSRCLGGLDLQSPDAPVRWVNRSSLWATQVGGTGQ